MVFVRARLMVSWRCGLQWFGFTGLCCLSVFGLQGLLCVVLVASAWCLAGDCGVLCHNWLVGLCSVRWVCLY